MRRWIGLLAFAGLGLAACSAPNDSPVAASSTKVVTLDAQATQLRADFNAASGSVRLLLLIDPACSVCLRGLADIDDALLKKIDDPRVQTFIVHTDVIGATPANVPPAAGLVHNRHVRHYWDPTGGFGQDVTNSLQLRQGADEIYAWDVWMIYDDKAHLPAVGVPPPALFMHQLPPLENQPGRPLLDGDVFAAEVNNLLARMPPAAAAN